jgi:hypothetical protein
MCAGVAREEHRSSLRNLLCTCSVSAVYLSWSEAQRIFYTFGDAPFLDEKTRLEEEHHPLDLMNNP